MKRKIWHGIFTLKLSNLILLVIYNGNLITCPNKLTFLYLKEMKLTFSRSNLTFEDKNQKPLRRPRIRTSLPGYLE